MKGNRHGESKADTSVKRFILSDLNARRHTGGVTAYGVRVVNAVIVSGCLWCVVAGSALAIVQSSKPPAERLESLWVFLAAFGLGALLHAWALFWPDRRKARFALVSVSIALTVYGVEGAATLSGYFQQPHSRLSLLNAAQARG